MKGQKIGYVRVSAFDQNVDRQLDGIALDRVFTDRASGKDVGRPQLAALLSFIREGDTLVVHRSEEHTSELQSLMRISYAVFCLKKKKKEKKPTIKHDIISQHHYAEH